MEIVCDSSALISLSETCSSNVLKFLAEKTGARFVTTQGVYEESVGRPENIGKYALSALRIKRAFSEGALGLRKIGKYGGVEKLLELGNGMFWVSGKKPLKIVHRGEMECLALLKELKGGALLMDEKTTRLLVEDFEQMKRILQGEFGGRVTVNEGVLKEWKAAVGNVAVLRSSEVVYEAFKRGYYKEFGKDERNAAKAAVYALRTSGCSLSFQEINEYEKEWTRRDF